VIFGKEITYNKSINRIEIIKDHYFDKNGKRGIYDSEALKAYIINIYKTIMYRGIEGTFIYVCDKDLNDYIKQNIPSYRIKLPFRILPLSEVKPYINSVPLVDITVAAGGFSDLKNDADCEWIELPFNVVAKHGYFVCKVVGESMNKKIPNGSYCLFRQDEGGSRIGKIVLVESTHIHDLDFGSGYTVKEYHSIKTMKNKEWSHESIILKPLTENSEFNDIELVEDELVNFRIVGIFECVLG
jgi:SOS-response transcriptional repressor LexA